MKFTVKITGGREDATYSINENTHHDTAAVAAAEALKTYRSHGHSTFPYNRGPLTITVERAEEAP